jgi:carbon starvation protein
MGLLLVALIVAACLVVAYRVYGSYLARVLRLSESRVTPAVEMRDDLDYAPAPPRLLLGQHFSAIAAAGPVVGPILAGVMFGWLPALIWIVVGCIFVGGVHDMASLVASVRHKARSIAEIVREHMSRRSYVLFLAFVWIALVYIIVAFTDLVAGSFVGAKTLEDGTTVTGGGIATSSLLYLALPLAMGLLLRFGKVSLGVATAVFLPLVAGAIVVGQWWPLDLAAIAGVSEADAGKWWAVILLAYCFVASLTPLWLLLQPRGHLGGYMLYAALGVGLVGIVAGGVTGKTAIEYPAFTGWVFTDARGNASPLFPILFITIACGACSGFHCLIASGTTSKQLRCELDAKPIGYGAMLMEGMVAVISLACVMVLSREETVGKDPNLIYAMGLAGFLDVFGVSAAIAISFGLLAFTTFVYDTLDVCARLGRFIVQELTGLSGLAGRVIGTALTVGAPAWFLLSAPVDEAGRPVPAWKVFWSLFGASNQLLAALALVGVTVWLWRTTRGRWVWPVVACPAALMYVMSAWALVRYVAGGFERFMASGSPSDLPSSPVPWVALVLTGLALLVLVEAIVVLLRSKGPPDEDVAEPALAA